MSNNQNKGEKCCDLCEGNHSLFTGNARIDCPCHTPQSVEKEEVNHIHRHTDHSRCSCGKPCDCDGVIFPQSNTLGTTMEEEVESVINELVNNTTPSTDQMMTIRFLRKRLPTLMTQSKAETQIEHCSEKDCPECNLKAYNKGKEDGKAETIKECRKLIEKEINLETLEDAITDICRQARNHMAEKLLKETLLSKDIEQ